MAEETHHFIEALTERESEVLLAMAEGMSNQEIANALHIALPTVKWYNSQIYSKLDVNNRDDAVNRARTLGLLDTDKTSPSDIPNNLPQESTAFVGRKVELRDLHDLLHQADTRLLTIIAQGGMGKTRLALRLAQHNLSNFANGIYLIQLAPLENDNALITALANALGLQHYDNSIDMKENLLKYVQSQQMLLIFDNFEHVLGASQLLSEIVKAAPHIKIISTSRERLNLQGEIVYVLAGMTLSDDNDEALQLFLQSTLRIRPDYLLNDDDLPHIIEICRLVDGLPLGIELAAAWMDTLSPEKIADEIRQSIAILETDLRDVPERHRSIQATFDYTWESLTQSERETMMSLSLFRGGFTQEAAEQVALANIRRLKHLLNKSLLYYDPIGRYSIHELLRQFCTSKLEESGNLEAIIEAYMSYYAAFMQPTYERMLRYDESTFRSIGADWENIAFAWQAMAQHERYDLIENMYPGMWKFSSMLGQSFECVALFKPVIEQLRPIVKDASHLVMLFANLLVRQSDMMSGIDSKQAANIVNDEAIAILEKQAPSMSLLLAYFSRIWFDYTEMKYAAEKAIIDKILHLAETIGARQYLISAYSALWYWDEFKSDTEAYQASLDHAYQLWLEYRDTDAMVGNCHSASIHMLMLLEKYDAAEQMILEGLVNSERTGWLYGISNARAQLMYLCTKAGKMDEYKDHLAAVIHWHHKYGRDWQLLGALQGFHGRGYVKFKAYEKAVEVFSFVYNHPVTVELAKIELQHHLTKARKNLDEAQFEAAWERGKRRTLKDVVAEAMAFWTN